MPGLRTVRVLRLAACLAALSAMPAGAHAAEAAPELARLRKHVEVLASPEFEGRRGEGAKKAAAYLVEAFRELGLEPLFDGSYEQPIAGRTPGTTIGRNVGGMLVGSDPELREEWIIVSAHFDHLGVQGGTFYPGADDNASGVAMMLEVARALAGDGERPRRSLMFVGFDLEESGLVGSRYFAENAPVSLKKVRLFVTADMIARALGGVCDPYVFAMGSEHAPALRPWIEQASENLDIKVGVIGSDLLFFDRSDYGPFRERQIPYLFFSTGENPRYHTPDDTPETLDYAKLEAVSRLVLGIVSRASAADSLPGWAEQADNPFGEALVIRDVLGMLLSHKEGLGIKALQVAWIEGQTKTLDEVIKRGSITPAERRKMVRAAQVVLYSVL